MITPLSWTPKTLCVVDAAPRLGLVDCWESSTLAYEKPNSVSLLLVAVADVLREAGLDTSLPLRRSA